MSIVTRIDGQTLTLKNLDKPLDQASKTTKAGAIAFYQQISPLILPHLADKPLSLIHFPHGTDGEHFYQKRCPADAPEFVTRQRLGDIEWCVCQNPATLAYLVGRGVLEMHPWFSTVTHPRQSRLPIIDLDPSGGATLADCVVVAKAFGVLLDQLGLFSLPKTSGGSGIHIMLPCRLTDFESIQQFLARLCAIVASTLPERATLERSIAKRGRRVYLDHVQVGFGKTITAPYSLRARVGMPVSTPLGWDELTDKLSAADFNINNTATRLATVGDLTKDFFDVDQALPKL